MKTARKSFEPGSGWRRAKPLAGASAFARRTPILRGRGSRAAFSLIELLVVLTVVAILAAILVPTISSIRSRTESTKCTSNLHTIGIGLFQFAIENNGRLPACWPTEGRSLMEREPDNHSISIPAGLGAIQYYGYIDGKSGVSVRGDVRSRIFDCPTRTSGGWDSYSNWTDYFYNFTGASYSADGPVLEELEPGRAIVFDFISITADTAVHNNETTSNVLYPNGSVKSFALSEYRTKNRNTCFILDR